ncbi:ABC transporter ATP-binding protein [Pseudonocardia pini]|uniref:ABC transporter ATP-binding protein n=1 Tax=Pseudonocardia pini TaxID=2758030 RepID=UPI0015F05462|nr:ABC transporter ATP-binding protein [Pseudonocardia pini]
MRIRLDAVTAGYAASPALREASLDVRAGTFVALVGPNGSGKSTLLKTLYRALRPRGGRALLAEEDLWRRPHREVARRVGVLGQEAVGGHDLTARESVALGRHPHLGPFGRLRPADHEVVADALRRIDGEHLADRPLSTLSGGERQRILLARALAQCPEVLLLDEPTNHLDPEHQIEVLELARGLGVTVVAALHSLDLAAQYADTLVVLAGGRVVAQGPPREVLEPALLRTVFRVAGSVVDDPETGAPRVLLRPR